MGKQKYTSGTRKEMARRIEGKPAFYREIFRAELGSIESMIVTVS
jgi:hypothetical protein